jgi:PPOX class probable F420-dependent enzyme
MAIPTIPDSHKVLFEKPILANLATVLPSGMIQVNPVWCDYDGTYVRFNSPEGGQKGKNVKRNGLATVLLVDPQDNYFWIEVRGHVVEITHEGADDHIDSLAKKYLGVDKYPFHREGVARLTYKIQPERVNTVSPR